MTDPSRTPYAPLPPVIARTVAAPAGGANAMATPATRRTVSEMWRVAIGRLSLGCLRETCVRTTPWDRGLTRNVRRPRSRDRGLHWGDADAQLAAGTAVAP